MTLWQQLEETARSLKSRISGSPKVGVILGTGLGGLGEKILQPQAIPYERIPHFPKATVESHKGQLVFGNLSKHPAVIMEGRFHLYEGYTPAEVTYPVRVMQTLGVETLILSNAAGGMNPSYIRGDLVAVTDHINLMGASPLAGPNDERLGQRFPDLSAPYDLKLVKAAEEAAQGLGIRLHRGVYVGVVGPNLETRAEYRFLRGIGADCVGMSTIPEVLVAVHARMRVLALSCITDLCFPETLEPAVFEEIVKVATAAQPKLAALVSHVIERL